MVERKVEQKGEPGDAAAPNPVQAEHEGGGLHALREKRNDMNADAMLDVQFHKARATGATRSSPRSPPVIANKPVTPSDDTPPGLLGTALPIAPS
jgi:hypothetical protein